MLQKQRVFRHRQPRRIPSDVLRSAAWIWMAVAATAAAQQTPIDASEASSTAKRDDQEEEKRQTLSLAEGSLQLTFPESWRRTKPRSSIIDYEFIIPGAEKDVPPGRMTVMNAGGSVHANIGRWVGQFRLADGEQLPELKLPEDGEKLPDDQPGYLFAKQNVAGLTVHTVDLRGTFLARPRGPFGPIDEKPNYRMLGLIIPSSDQSRWFVKFNGPQATVDKQAKAFQRMVAEIMYLPPAEPDDDAE